MFSILTFLLYPKNRLFVSAQEAGTPSAHAPPEIGINNKKYIDIYHSLQFHYTHLYTGLFVKGALIRKQVTVVIIETIYYYRMKPKIENKSSSFIRFVDIA